MSECLRIAVAKVVPKGPGPRSSDFVQRFAAVWNRDGDYRDVRSRMSGQGQTKFRVQLARSVWIAGRLARVQIGETAVGPGNARGWGPVTSFADRRPCARGRC